MYALSTERRAGRGTYEVHPRCRALGRRRPSAEVTSRRWSSTCPRGACYTTRRPHAHTHIDTHVDAHIDAHAHTHTVHTHTRIHTHTYCSHTRTHTHTYTHTHTQTHTHTHTLWSEHANTHTHTQQTINIQFASTCAVARSKRAAAPCTPRHGKEGVIVHRFCISLHADAARQVAGDGNSKPQTLNPKP